MTGKSVMLTDLTDSYGIGKGKSLEEKRALGRLRVRMHRRHWDDDLRPHVSLYITETATHERHAAICLDRTQVPRLIRALERFMKETGK